MVPAWSPDGSWIAYENLEGTRWGLGKVSLGGGGKPIQLIPVSDERLVRPQWSPGGDWLTWLPKDGLALVSPDGSRTELLSGAPGWQGAVGFTKDGSEVVAIRANEDHHFAIESIDIHSKRRRVIRDLGPQTSVHGFSLAPDGKSFLTTLERTHSDIWILDGFPKP